MLGKTMRYPVTHGTGPYYSNSGYFHLIEFESERKSEIALAKFFLEKDLPEQSLAFFQKALFIDRSGTHRFANNPSGYVGHFGH